MDVEVFRGKCGYTAQISECFNKGNIILHGNDKWCRVGGITSFVISVSACYNLGEVFVDGADSVIGNFGGIAGGTDTGIIEVCYNVGSVKCDFGKTSTRRIGEIVGVLDGREC